MVACEFDGLTMTTHHVMVADWLSASRDSFFFLAAVIRNSFLVLCH